MNNWLAAAAAGVLALFGGTSTADHRPPHQEDFKGNSSTTRPVNKNVDIACVAAAVAAREASLQSGESTFALGLANAYSTRANALASAYTLTGNDAVKTAVKAAWKQFKANAQGARSAWQKSKENSWLTFRAAVKKCGPGASAVTDSENSSADFSGND